MVHDNEIDSIIYYWSLDNFDEIGERESNNIEIYGIIFLGEGEYVIA